MCRKSVHTFRLKPNNFQMNYRFETHCKKKPVIRFDILTQKTTKNSITVMTFPGVNKMPRETNH